MLLQFPLVTLGSALRATGIVKPAVGLQVLSVALNMVLAPLLIFGLLGLPRLGVTGAALATFISILIADVLMVIYLEKKYHLSAVPGGAVAATNQNVVGDVANRVTGRR